MPEVLAVVGVGIFLSVVASDCYDHAMTMQLQHEVPKQGKHSCAANSRVKAPKPEPRFSGAKSILVSTGRVMDGDVNDTHGVMAILTDFSWYFFCPWLVT